LSTDGWLIKAILQARDERIRMFGTLFDNEECACNGCYGFKCAKHRIEDMKKNREELDRLQAERKNKRHILW
jgi:hypothetical protein